MAASRGAELPRIGCSGWNYSTWKGRFYRDDLPASRWLAAYAQVFDTVEVNNTFYRLPEASTFERWRLQTPSNFLMAVKASRFLTHMKRLRDPEEPLDRLLSRATALGPKLGPLLYQLPANFLVDLDCLETFLVALSKASPPRSGRRLRHVFEFRHPSWYVAETYSLLERHRVAMCLHDKAGSAVSSPLVGPFVYVRFHGASGRYHGSYGDERLRQWATVLAGAWADGKATFAYFNNDPDAVATENALTLKRLLSRRLKRIGAGDSREPSTRLRAVREAARDPLA